MTGRRLRRRAATVLLITSTVPAILTAAALPSAPAAAASTPTCPAEQYPKVGTPRDHTPAVPYEIPISAHIQNGYLQGTTSSGLTAVIGPVNATACGLATLPSLTGSIQPQDVQVNPPTGLVNVSLLVTGLVVAQLLAQVNGIISASLSHVAAPNGGINATLELTLKVTVLLNVTAPIPLLPTLPIPSIIACTLIAGDARGNAAAMGVSAADLNTMQAKYVSNPPFSEKQFNYFTPFMGTTGTSYGPGRTATSPTTAISGEPVTGPPTDGQAEAVDTDTMLGKFFSDIPNLPAPNGTKPIFSCSKFGQSATDTLLNGVLGLPLAAGQGNLTAPTTFSINIT